MKLLRLPSGQFFNVETIVNTGKQIYHQGHAGDDSLFTVYVNALDEDGSDIRHFEGPDARALYKWLEANATAIGEDGREVMEPALNTRQWSVLKLLNRVSPLFYLNIKAETDANLQDISKLVEMGLVDRSVDMNTGTFYNLSDAGRAAIEGD